MIELKMKHEAEKRVAVSWMMNGSTDDLLDELAVGMADVLIQIGDDLPVVDEIHESLARVMTSKVIDLIRVKLDLREQEKDKPPEA